MEVELLSPENSSEEISARVARGSFTILITQVSAAILGAVFAIIMARLLGPRGYGIVGVGLGLLAVLRAGASFGVPQAIGRFVSKYATLRKFSTVKRVLRISFRYLLVLCLCFSGALALLAGPIATHIYHDPGLTNAFRVVALILTAYVLFTGINRIFQGFQRMRYVLFTRVLYQVLRVLVAVALVLAGFFATGALLGVGAALILACVLALIFLVPRVLPERKSRERVNDTKLSREIISYAFPVLVGGLAGVLLLNYGTLALGSVASMEEAGFYAAAFALSISMVRLPGVMGYALFPAVSERWTLRDKRGLESAITTTLKMIFTVLIPLVVGGIIFSEFVMGLIYGKEFMAGANVLRVLLITLLLWSLDSINTSIFEGIGRPDVNAKIRWAAVAVGIASVTALAMKYGAIGAAVGYSAATVVLGCLGVYFVAKLTGLRYPLRIFWRPLLATGAMLLFIVPLRFVAASALQAVLIGVGGLLIYTYAFLKLGGIRAGDIRVLKRISSDMGKPGVLEKIIRFLERYA